MLDITIKFSAMKMFNHGNTIQEVIEKYNISEPTANEWKEEWNLVGEIFNLLKNKNIYEAKEKIDDFRSKTKSVYFLKKMVGFLVDFHELDDYTEELCNEILSLDKRSLNTRYKLVVIAKRKNDLKTVERLSNEILKINPKNLPCRYQLIKISSENNDWIKVEKLCNEILKLDPNNLPVRYQFITAAKQMKDWKTVERLCNEILELDPDNESARKQLAAIERNRGNTNAVEDIQEEIQKLDLKDDEEIKTIELKMLQEAEGIELNSEDSYKSPEQQIINEARKQIRLMEELSKENVQAIQQDLEAKGISSSYIHILLAEAYERKNLPNGTKMQLKEALKETDDPKLQKTIKGLLNSAQSEKKNPTHMDKWETVITSLKVSESNLVLKERE